MDDRIEDRINAVVEDLLRGRRPKIGAGEASDREAIMVAATRAASCEGHPSMSPALRRRLTVLLSRTPESPLIDRRAALAAVAGLAVGAAGALGIGRLTGSEQPEAGAPPAGILRPATTRRWIAVGLLSEFPDKKATPVVAGNVQAYIFRTGDTLSAVSSICSDLPCSLDWREGDATLYCPCHRQEFAVDGVPRESSYRPAVPRLATFRVRVDSGRVLVLAL